MRAIGQGTIYTFESPEKARKIAHEFSKENIPAETLKGVDNEDGPYGVVTGMLGMEYRVLKKNLDEQALADLDDQMTDTAGFSIYA